jgi:hypothetical protein
LARDNNAGITIFFIVIFPKNTDVMHLHFWSLSAHCLFTIFAVQCLPLASLAQVPSTGMC